MKTHSLDYLVLGSGLSALTFAALMAKKKKRVALLEAHEFFGGYGHTFEAGPYSFNAHLHYVVGCEEGGVVNTVLKKLELEREILFTTLDSSGFDRAHCEGKLLKIPRGLEKLGENMIQLFPKARRSIAQFIDLLKYFSDVADSFPRHTFQSYKLIPELNNIIKLMKFKNATLQQVFDYYALPPLLQTLVAGQLLDYLLPPRELSFLVWAALFTAYSKGAYYPVKHFSHVVNSLVKCIKENDGLVINNTQVTSFLCSGKKITGVYSHAVDPTTGISFGSQQEYYAKNIICNFDPKKAAHMIGINKFSPDIRRRLNYDYCASSFVLYGIVKNIDLRDHGFGSWNIWHCQPDHNSTFDAMFNNSDYSKPYFAMNSCSLHNTQDRSNCPLENHQVFQMLTVANYKYWADLKLRDRRAYIRKKNDVLNTLLDIVEEYYVPNIREHLVFKMTGSPTTNERYVRAPEGGAYGVRLTPQNFYIRNKLDSFSSLQNFYFCSAAAGLGGFSGAFNTGLRLYEILASDYLA